MNRIIESVKILNGYLEGLDDDKLDLFEGSLMAEMLHGYGTAYLSAAIASARGLKPRLAFIIGLMHDTARIVDNGQEGTHAEKGAEIVKKLLGETGKFNSEELDIVYSAIYNHSNKKDIGSEYEEVIKDADVLERLFLMKDTCENSKKKRKRLKTSLEELGLKLYKKR